MCHCGDIRIAGDAVDLGYVALDLISLQSGAT